ncbi:Uncharacterised protein [Mycobacterium tuberculosis]|nr:Uncharacterised protein [Mycobacterium tuberculosis]
MQGTKRALQVAPKHKRRAFGKTGAFDLLFDAQHKSGQSFKQRRLQRTAVPLHRLQRIQHALNFDRIGRHLISEPFAQIFLNRRSASAVMPTCQIFPFTKHFQIALTLFKLVLLQKSPADHTLIYFFRLQPIFELGVIFIEKPHNQTIPPHIIGVQVFCFRHRFHS